MRLCWSGRCGDCRCKVQRGFGEGCVVWVTGSLGVRSRTWLRFARLESTDDCRMVLVLCLFRYM